MPPSVQESIDAGDVPPTIGYEIAKVPDRAKQVELAEKVARGEVGRAEVRDQTVEGARPKPWNCSFEDGAQVTVKTPGGDGDLGAVVEKLQAALKRAKVELSRTRSDAA